MIYFFHHYELPAILTQQRMHQMMQRTRANRANSPQNAPAAPADAAPEAAPAETLVVPAGSTGVVENALRNGLNENHATQAGEHAHANTNAAANTSTDSASAIRNVGDDVEHDSAETSSSNSVVVAHIETESSSENLTPVDDGSRSDAAGSALNQIDSSCDDRKTTNADSNNAATAATSDNIPVSDNVKNSTPSAGTSSHSADNSCTPPGSDWQSQWTETLQPVPNVDGEQATNSDTELRQRRSTSSNTDGTDQVANEFST